MSSICSCALYCCELIIVPCLLLLVFCVINDPCVMGTGPQGLGWGCMQPWLPFDLWWKIEPKRLRQNTNNLLISKPEKAVWWFCAVVGGMALGENGREEGGRDRVGTGHPSGKGVWQWSGKSRGNPKKSGKLWFACDVLPQVTIVTK